MNDSNSPRDPRHHLPHHHLIGEEPSRPTRRRFLGDAASLMAGAALLSTQWTIPGFLSRSAHAARRLEPAAAVGGAPVLVIVQLTGGNDGLNTVIPFEDDRYHRARPTLRVPGESVLRLNTGLALHPEMSGFRELYEDGRLAIVNNVGYANPDRSHFRSLEIWHTACNHPETTDRGWLGKAADLRYAEGAPPLTVHFGSEAVPLALRGHRATAPSIRDVRDMRLGGDAENLEEMLAQPRSASLDDADSDLLFVQRVAVSSCQAAARVEGALQYATMGGTEYPPYGLANRLRQIALLIQAGFGARVYYTSLGGFDTHARQELAHGPLLRELSASVHAFTNDLRRRGLSDRVLVLTFSEFGRRVAENGSRGTDHGAAAPLFVVGDAVRPGLHGEGPDLGRLIEGDVAHAVDFRDVYATVLRSWLGIDPAPVLGGEYAGLNLIRS